MKLGFVLTSNPNKPSMARSFTSLIKTNVSDLERPVIQLTHRAPWEPYIQYVTQLQKSWDVNSNEDFPGIYGWNALASLSGDKLIKETDVTHIGFLADDFIYNPEWLHQLTALIERHEDAKAWSVYRSRYTRHHRILHIDNTGDVVMTMHDAVGVMTRQEWEEYGASKRSDFTCPEEMGGGCTMDIHHAYIRKGERWATGKDYIQNIGVHPGLENIDCAIEFVGE